MEARLKKAIGREHDAAIAQGKTNQTGRIDDQVVAARGDAVDVAVAGESGDDGRAFVERFDQPRRAGNHAAVPVEVRQNPRVDNQQQGAAVDQCLSSGRAQGLVERVGPDARSLLKDFAVVEGIGESQAQARGGLDDRQRVGIGKAGGKTGKGPTLGVAVVVAGDGVERGFDPGEGRRGLVN